VQELCSALVSVYLTRAVVLRGYTGGSFLDRREFAGYPLSSLL
jgi:hypothetical protein